MSGGFAATFGRAPDAVASAPGRVNLLGEHTDYNDGFVLPIALSQQTTVALGRAAGQAFTLRSDNLGRGVSFGLERPPEEQFARYVFGCLHEMTKGGRTVPPLDIHVASDVPIGVGLSSSAALEVATLRALRGLLGADIDDVEIARMAQRAEIEHAGVRCGIMDQMASSLAGTERALFLDTRTLQTRLLDLPPDTTVLVLDSGIERSLAGSGFNQRRRECEEAAAQLGLESLREVDDLAVVESLAEPWRRRARHVVSENARVLRAVQGVTAAAFGELMNGSHASLRDDYEVSVPPLDTLVSLLQQRPGVFGARLTGAGFGGACVALCASGQAGDVAEAVLAAYARSGQTGRVLAPPDITPAARSPRT
ncbi:MAG TPA: galactokinase [Caldimonas sp.]|jgi:galactokinase|nr:galactokinase [Caldimonas sp.]HEX2542037.1 galactokinase [Caldimonas sp.]